MSETIPDLKELIQQGVKSNTEITALQSSGREELQEGHLKGGGSSRMVLLN